MKRTIQPGSFSFSRFRQIITFGVLACLAMGLPLSTNAGGIVSNCTEADLRAALTGGGTVTLACDGTFALANTLVITNDTLLDAAGRSVTLSGGGSNRLVVVNPGVTLTLRHLTLADGMARGTDGPFGADGGRGEGGAIYNNGGVLVVSDCTFLRNKALGGSGGPGTNSPPTPPGSGGAGRGGAVHNSNGQVNATGCVFVFNQGQGGDGGTDTAYLAVSGGGNGVGGAISTIGGRVLVVNSLVASNAAIAGLGRRYGTPYAASGSACGGALYSQDCDASLAAVRFIANSSLAVYLSAGSGGAVFKEGGGLSISNCWFCANQASGGVGLAIGTPLGISGGPGLGGAVYIASGLATATNSTFSDNTALGGKAPGPGNYPGSGCGGAIYSAGTMEMLNCTLAGNAARCGKAFGGSGGAGANGNGQGGGLYNNGGTLLLTHLTIASNTAARSASGSTNSGLAQGGAIYSLSGPVTLRNTILSHSVAASNWFGATLVDDGNNLSSDTSCPFTRLDSRNNIDPLLGPLADYGGPTPTMALLAGSPAVDSANPLFCPPADQRARARPFGATCDIGAFESSPPYVIFGELQGQWLPPGGATISVGSLVTNTDALRRFRFDGLPAGSYLVVPTHPETVFVLSNRTVTVGPDALSVNFHAYRSNALTMEKSISNLTRTVFAGATGETFLVIMSSNLSSWVPYSTNKVALSGLFEFYENPGANGPVRFFRTARP